MKFDPFLAIVGDWGKFQKIKYSLICFTYTLPAIMVYTYTFSAATPNFRCQHPMLSSMDEYIPANNQLFNREYQPTKEQCAANHRLISLKECQRCFIRSFSNNNQSTNGSLVSCEVFVFDRKYYKKTLVEEVRTTSVGMKI